MCKEQEMINLCRRMLVELTVAIEQGQADSLPYLLKAFDQELMKKTGLRYEEQDSTD